MYENCKGNNDYDLNSNNEIAKVKQLEIEIGKSMMSLVFWEMWNENHGEIDEKVWVNQKNKKIKDEKLGFVIRTKSELRNTMPIEMKSHKTEIVPNRSCAITYLINDRRALWDFHALCEISMLSQFQAFSKRVIRALCVCGLRSGLLNFVVGFFKGWKFCCGLFSRGENFVIFYQGLWAEETAAFFFFFFTFISRVILLFWGTK